MKIKTVVLVLLIAVMATGLLSGCIFNESRYEKAVALLNEGATSSDFKEAAEIFGKLGDYKDSTTLEADAREKELIALQKMKIMVEAELEVTNCRLQLQLGNVAGAQKIFNSFSFMYEGWLATDRDDMDDITIELIDFTIERYELGMCEMMYEMAIHSMEQGNYGAAVTLFERIRDINSDFKDSTEKLKECYDKTN